MVTHNSRAGSLTRPGLEQDPHRSLHSEAGAVRGEHPGRSRDPLVKVAGLAWLEFEKPDLGQAERFATDFGFTVAGRTPEELVLRGRQAAAPCLVVRRGRTPRFAGPAFQAAARADLDRLAGKTGGTVTAHRGGHAVQLTDPSGFPVTAPGTVNPSPKRTARRSAAGVKPPSQIGGCGFWISSGVTLTFWKSKKSLLKVTVSPARARRMMSSDWSVRAPRSLEDTPKPTNSSRLKPIAKWRASRWLLLPMIKRR